MDDEVSASGTIHNRKASRSVSSLSLAENASRSTAHKSHSCTKLGRERVVPPSPTPQGSATSAVPIPV
jgi:hypothetical protein